jgi:hypothetical protein
MLRKRSRCTLTVKYMQFYCTVLDSILAVGKVFRGTRLNSFWSAGHSKSKSGCNHSEVSSACVAPSRTCFRATRAGHAQSNASGESHLWVRHCKVSNLSGFVEGRIHRLDGVIERAGRAPEVTSGETLAALEGC